jgi:hypothetical protein
MAIPELGWDRQAMTHPDVRHIVVDLWYLLNSDPPVQVAIGYHQPTDNVQLHA